MAKQKQKSKRWMIELRPGQKPPMQRITRHVQTLWGKPVTITEALNWTVQQMDRQLAAEAAVVGAPVAHKHD
jgi:hypothetical protein